MSKTIFLLVGFLLLLISNLNSDVFNSELHKNDTFGYIFRIKVTHNNLELSSGEAEDNYSYYFLPRLIFFKDTVIAELGFNHASRNKNQLINLLQLKGGLALGHCFDDKYYYGCDNMNDGSYYLMNNSKPEMFDTSIFDYSMSRNRYMTDTLFREFQIEDKFNNVYKFGLFKSEVQGSTCKEFAPCSDQLNFKDSVYVIKTFETLKLNESDSVAAFFDLINFYLDYAKYE